jgi:hypothetical protein
MFLIGFFSFLVELEGLIYKLVGDSRRNFKGFLREGVWDDYEGERGRSWANY